MWNWLRERNPQKAEEAERHLLHRRTQVQQRRTNRRTRAPVRWSAPEDGGEPRRTRQIESAWARHDENVRLLEQMQQAGALDDDEYLDATLHERLRYQREILGLLDSE